MEKKKSLKKRNRYHQGGKGSGKTMMRQKGRMLWGKKGREPSGERVDGVDGKGGKTRSA